MADGVMTNKELVGSLITDLNNLVKVQQSGQHLQACQIIVSMTQKLANLYKTIDDDIKNRDETIESLKEQIRSLGMEVVDMPPSEFLKEQNNGE